MHSELEIHESKQRRPVFQPIEAPCTVLAAHPLNLKLIAVSGREYVSALSRLARMLPVCLLHTSGVALWHMPSHERAEVAIGVPLTVSFVKIVRIQLHCRHHESWLGGAGHFIPMQLTCDDSILASARQHGLRVWKLVELKSFCHHCFPLVVQLGTPL